jgi:hypothetical protein
MVVEVFCAGCNVREKCPKYPFPKIQPHVGRFLARMNIVERIRQQIYPPDWRMIPYAEWEMLKRYTNVRNTIDAERAKRVTSNAG